MKNVKHMNVAITITINLLKWPLKYMNIAKNERFFLKNNNCSYFKSSFLPNQK